MADQPRTLEQIQGTIRAARDSVWVIQDTLTKLSDGAAPSKDLKGNLDRNIGHLELVVASQDVVESGENIADLHEAIAAGKAKLAENIWPNADN
jgi:hypothetical protein